VRFGEGEGAHRRSRERRRGDPESAVGRRGEAR
jgi:hypothetical protein